MIADSGGHLVKYGVAAVLASLYMGLSAWIISGEGQSYREDLQKTLAIKTDLPSPPSSEPKPEDVPERPAAKKKAQVVEKTKKKAQPVEKAQTDATESDPPEAKPEPPPAPKVVSRPASAPAPAGPAVDPFWNQPEQTKNWDFDKLTDDDERELGAALHQMVLHVTPALKVGPLPRRLEQVVDTYRQSVNRKEITYTTTVLDCECPNIFSLPGGYIYVCKGLFDWFVEADDYGLEFAVLHEMAHVDMKHAITCLRSPDVKKKANIGTARFFAFILIPGGYYRSLMQDDEADRWALTQMQKAGRLRYHLLYFLRKLEDYAKNNGFENGFLNPNDEPRVPLFDNHIRAHPPAYKRLKAMKAILTPASTPKA